jgi:putative flippase GtrA
LSARLQFLRFAGVGAAGFLVDAGTLWLAMQAGAGPLTGRLASYLAAATFTWALNRRLTFRDRSAGLLAQWARFLAVNAVGGGVNYAVYAALVLSGGIFALHPTIAVGAGSIAGLAFNFGFSKRLVFRGA